MKKRSIAAFEGASCPCCIERISYTGSRPYKADTKSGLCGTCDSLDSFAAELPPFEWPTDVAAIEAAAAKVLADAEANLAAVASAEPPTFETVIHPLMCPPNYKTNHLVCQAKFLQHASTNAQVRAAAEEAGKQFAAFKAASRRNSAVYAKVKAFAATAECAALGSHEAHFVRALLDDFQRGGLALDESGRDELQRLLDADAAACAKYGSNLGSDATKLFFTVGELEGLPDGFVTERKGADGKVAVTLKYPDLIPIMGNCEVQETRRRVLEARESAYADNLELMAEGVRLRKQTAALLGFPSWAHYVIAPRMAGTPEAVVAFLGKIQALAEAGAKADLEKLRCAKAEHLRARGEAPAAGEAAVEL